MNLIKGVAIDGDASKPDGIYEKFFFFNKPTSTQIRLYRNPRTGEWFGEEVDNDYGVRELDKEEVQEYIRYIPKQHLTND